VDHTLSLSSSNSSDGVLFAIHIAHVVYHMHMRCSFCTPMNWSLITPREPWDSAVVSVPRAADLLDQSGNGTKAGRGGALIYVWRRAFGSIPV
jgi:hypothetical protein